MTSIILNDPDGLVRVNRGRRSGGSGLLAGVLLGLVVAGIANGGDPKPSTTQAVAAAENGHYNEAWSYLQLRPRNRYVQSAGPSCSRYSWGQVRQFFIRTPCHSLRRALLVVGTDTDTIAISVSWVQMPSTSAALRLRPILDKPGTGDIRPISGRTMKLGDIRFTGRHYSSRRSGAMVVIAEAELVRGHPSADLLNAAAQVAAALPPR